MAEVLSENKKRILVVDEDSETLERLRSYLEPEYLVGTVNYGEFVLEYIEKNATDLILMDAEKPMQDDFSIIKSIRDLEEDADIPIMFMTDKSNRNAVLDSINLGVDAYIMKPVSKDTLLGKISDVISHQERMKTKKTILAVDDDVTYLKIINNSLRDNFNVIMVNSTKMAMEYLDYHTPSLVIVDYQISKFNGTSVIDYMIENLDMTDVPVIIMTGINDKKAAMTSIANKPCKFLLKPVSKLDLMRAIISAFSDYGKTIR